MLYNEDQYVFFAKCFDEMRDFKSEYEVYSLGLARNKQSAFLYAKRAHFFSRMRDYDVSIREYDLAIKFESNDSLRLMHTGDRAWVKFLKGDFDGAIEDCQTVLGEDSSQIYAMNTLGIVYSQMKEYEKAEYYIIESYKMDSLNSFSAGNVGFFYQEFEKYEKSMYHFERAIELNALNYTAYNNRGYSKLMLGDIEGALEDVNQGMEIQEYNSYAYRNRALIYLEMGKTEKACEDMAMAEALDFSTTYGNELINLQKRYCQ